MRRQTERNLAARRQQDNVGRSLAVGDDVGSLRDARRGGETLAVERRKNLAREDDHGRRLIERHDRAIRFGDLVRVRRAEDGEVRDRAQRREMLHRLVRRTVFADPDRVVREDEERRNFHERGEANHRAQEVREDEERRAVSAQPGKNEPVRNRAHRVLAHAEMKVATGLVGSEIAVAWVFKRGVVRGRKVRRAADKPRKPRRELVENLAARRAACESFFIRRKRFERRVPVLREFAGEDRVEFLRLLRIRFAVFREFRLPFVGELRAALSDVFVEERVNVVVDRELLLGVESVELLRAGDFLVAERRAVGGGGPFFRRRAVRDTAVNDD